MSKKKEIHRVEVNCKTCGTVIDCSHDPENWCLQCDACKSSGVALPAGYEKLAGGKHDK